jgi:hypothetical protein
MNSEFKQFLTLFFQLFSARVEKISLKDKDRIRGVIIFDDGSGEQEFEYMIRNDLQQVNQLLRFLIEHNLTSSDRIIISKEALLNSLQRMGWESEIALSAIQILENIRIPMIDEEKISDFFLLHYES